MPAMTSLEMVSLLRVSMVDSPSRFEILITRDSEERFDGPSGRPCPFWLVGRGSSEMLEERESGRGDATVMGRVLMGPFCLFKDSERRCNDGIAPSARDAAAATLSPPWRLALRRRSAASSKTSETDLRLAGLRGEDAATEKRGGRNCASSESDIVTGLRGESGGVADVGLM